MPTCPFVCSDLCVFVVLHLLSCYLGCHVHVVQQSLVAVKFPVFFGLQRTLVNLVCQMSHDFMVLLLFALSKRLSY